MIVDAISDDEVLEWITGELDRRLPLHDDLDAYVRALASLPTGLRSMAATYQLDVSITLDDLGWHFGNWHHHEYALETARGLRVLGTIRGAELFETAYAHALRHWDRVDQPDWMEWYHGSPLEAAVEPLNREMWELFREDGKILRLWVQYARRHPALLNEGADRRAMG
jgi:hypothetical protein